MHHLPRFFSPRERPSNAMDPKKLRRKPKLERRNALKYSDYDAGRSTSSSLDSSSSSGGSLYTRSMEIFDRTSFRIEGTEGEFDRICRSLGLSGPEDFAIPAAAWEAMKVRSSSDILPRLKLGGLEEEREEEREEREPERNDVAEGGLGENCEDTVRVRVRDEPAETSGCCAENGGVCGGIKGVRPPMLKPPPGMRVPVVDDTCSTWDLLRDFAPQGEGHPLNDSDDEHLARREPDKEEEDEQEEEEKEGEEEGAGGEVGGGGGGASPKREEEGEGADNAVRLAEIVAELSGSCGFSTSNEDDTSSTTTGPRSNNISPNGRIKRIITTGDWQKGELLGRGSFGSVYEGISG